MRRVLFVFLDGVGLAADDPAWNPLAAARLPTLTALLGGRRPVLENSLHSSVEATLVGIDATLGVDGLPQSGTGQATLLTGVDAVRRFGRHFGPWVPTALRPLVAERSILALAVRAGLRVAFANAYPEEVLAAPPRSRMAGPLRVAPPLAARAAGLLTRHTSELERGDAVASEITNESWRKQLGRERLPRIGEAEAGRNLVRIAAAHDLTLFAHYATDIAGHLRDLGAGVRVIERVDAFLGGVLDNLPGEVLLLVASDHGNLEDARVSHTRNPALCLLAGEGHREIAGRLRALTDVAPAVLSLLGVSGD